MQTYLSMPSGWEEQKRGTWVKRTIQLAHTILITEAVATATSGVPMTMLCWTLW